MSKPQNTHSASNVLATKPGVGILIAQGTTPPTDGALGYAAGCIFIDTDAADGSTLLVNEGSATSADFNTVTGGVSLAELTATAAEMNAVADVSGRQIVVTTATLTMTTTAHAGRVVVLDSTHTQTIILPAASGSGNEYTFVVQTLGTDGSKVIRVANATDIMRGSCMMAHTTAASVNGFIATATDDTLTMNNTTSGGQIGDLIFIRDVAAGIFLCRYEGALTGNPITPFSSGI